MNEQPTLFDDVTDDAPEPAPLRFANPVAHAGDPSTSHAAAALVTETGTRARHAAAVLKLVREHPASTAIELMHAQTDTDLDEYQIRRRLTDLKAAGLVVPGEARVCRRRGTKMLTWRARAQAGGAGLPKTGEPPGSPRERGRSLPWAGSREARRRRTR